MNYGLWSIVIICATTLGVTAQIVYLIISRRRAERLGILRVKYPVWNGGTALSAFVAVLGIIVIIISAVCIPRDLADLADYQTRLLQDEELYDHLITKTENALARDRFQLVVSIAFVVMEFLSIFTRGAYITKDGIIFFASTKLLKTSAKIENGKICVYINGDESRALTKLPANEKNTRLFSEFITPE